MALRIYLDTSVYNRPFDDQRQPRIWLETLAFSVVLQLLEDNVVDLITSSVVGYENSRNPHTDRQIWVTRVMTLAVEYQLVTPQIRQRAIDLEGYGLKALDALHVACAELSQAEYFVTCDDRLINRYQNLAKVEKVVIVANPTEFIRVTGV